VHRERHFQAAESKQIGMEPDAASSAKDERSAKSEPLVARTPDSSLWLALYYKQGRHCAKPSQKGDRVPGGKRT
jgi:hypothetical protein